ncbi:MAG: DUF1206 domain-containing protein [Novosphingobium pentaromativorans]|uniref:DUF1206 domain-containing protein n=1 Tax=Novosphingobium pentaromativorans TaxID=205844 RepID=A0A2W5NHK2_9SPHN|nr:MAG: DUF1206 domain-containing protein [Novosphingobium pentaromativorans]
MRNVDRFRAFKLWWENAMTYSDRMTVLARLGFAARGLVYILVGWLAFDASRTGAEPSDNQGALGTLGDTALGHVILAICAIGFAGYAFWRLAEGALDPEARGRTNKGKFERVAHLVSGGANALLCIIAGRLALRSSPANHGSPGDESAQSWSAWLLDKPGGVALLVAVGLGLFMVAAAQALKAYKAGFDELDGDVPAPSYVRWIGRLGYSARAVVFAMIGWLLISAALQHDPTRAGGLGDALAELRAQPEGSWILAIIGVGLSLFGVFSLVEARYRRLRVPIPRTPTGLR